MQAVHVTNQTAQSHGPSLNTKDRQHTQVSLGEGQGLNLLHTQKLVDSEVTQTFDQVNGCGTNKPKDNNTGVAHSVNSPCYENVNLNTSCTAVGLDPWSYSDRMVAGSNLVNQVSATAPVNSTEVYEGLIPIYDASIAGVEEIFANSLIHFRQFNDCPVHVGAESQIFIKWSDQSDFQFGFIPLDEQKCYRILVSIL